ncbi:MAG: TIGR01777 family oxidoreductase [Acidobacteria bacterium]|nr:TIGR01777 family oxidoreductase [Acidobacteriota bacterium]
MPASPAGFPRDPASARGPAPGAVAITGASGLLGGRLAADLLAAGARVLPVVRRAARPGSPEIAWDPRSGTIDEAALADAGAVVHLAGENIGAGRWTARRKEAIRSSRVEATSALAGALARLARPPRVFVCASATGFYGDRGDEILDESSRAGEGFLADVCRGWEAACEPARAAGIRVVHARLGVVLARGGGMLARLVPLYRLGLGGPVGSGRQWMSWVAIGDAIAAFRRAIADEAISGPVNVVAPGPVTNGEFARGLGRAVRRPAFVPLPGFAVRLALGEMGQELLLASSRVVPAALQAHGFRFRHATLESALEAEVSGVPGEAGR